jgi:hypothetical protein
MYHNHLFLIFVIHAERERLWPEFTKTALVSAVFGNPAICHSQTGSFASPACAGYALERTEVEHEKIDGAPCRSAQTGKENARSKV